MISSDVWASLLEVKTDNVCVSKTVAKAYRVESLPFKAVLTDDIIRRLGLTSRGKDWQCVRQ